jgi:PHD/YefM family antitoxin component YafN of YafNO toxin-antitoxin module
MRSAGRVVAFQSVDATTAGPELSRLRQEVATTGRRVEITAADGATCVVISKTELDSLERAIELLSDNEQVRELTAAVGAIAREAIGAAG